MAEAKRILLGKSVNTGLGHAANDPKHGLWVSKTGYDVTASTTTPDELAFNSDLLDNTEGITTKNGQTFGVKYSGAVTLTVGSDGNAKYEKLLVSWPESTFTKTTTGVVNGATSSSTSVSINTANASIAVGMTVTGSGISGSVTVTALSSNALTVTLSSAQSIADGVTLTFSIIYAPLVFVQGAKGTDSSPSTQYGAGSWYRDNQNNVNYGVLAEVFPKNRTSTGAYDANGTYGAAWCFTYAASAGDYKVYYAVCFPGIDIDPN